MIAYYAHQQGFGHCNSAQRFFKAFPKKTIVITASDYHFDEDTEVVKICNEDTNYITYLETSENLPKYAHYLPKSKAKILHRNFQLLESCISENIHFALVDVSVETAIQFRIAGIPYAYHKMLGNREDLPHQMAYEASEFLFAFYPKAFDTLKSKLFMTKTHYLGFISRFKFEKTIPKLIKNQDNSYSILILIGKGGTKFNASRIKSLCFQFPNSKFAVVGTIKNLRPIANLKILDFTSNIKKLINSNDIIIASCGLNLTAEILSLKHKFIAFKEERAYDEQELILQGLTNENLAVPLNVEHFENSVKELIELPEHPNLKNLFGKMSDFKTIEKLKPFL